MRSSILSLIASLLFSTAGLSQTQTIPYFQDFESGPGGWTDTSFSAGSVWDFGTPNFSNTTGAHSGNLAWDINLSSPYGNNANCVLTSPVFDFDSVPAARLSFWKNINVEAGWDGLRLEISVNGGGWQTLGFYNDPGATNWYNFPLINSGNQPGWSGNSGWQQCTYNLNGFTGQLVQFRYVFTSDGTGIGVGVSIDDFEITPLSGTDLSAVVLLYNPVYAHNAVIDSFAVIVQNTGFTALTGFTAGRIYNGNTSNGLPYQGTLMPNMYDTVYVPGITVDSGATTLCVFVNANGDTLQFNDTICGTFSVTYGVNLNYTENFDNGPGGWTTATNGNAFTNWELGSPSFGTTNSTHSGNTCWDINLFSPYQSGANTILYSPLIQFDTVYQAELSFWHNTNTENNFDGFRLEYAVNGSPWQLLGAMGDPKGTNWYNSTSLFSSNMPGWSGNYFGWTKSSYRLLNMQNNSVQFRFIFTSDPNVTGDGVSIDDFSLTASAATDLAVIGMSPSFGNFLDGSMQDSVSVTVRNEGNAAQTGFTVSYNYNGNIVTSAPFSGTLVPYDTVTIKIAGYTWSSNANQLCVYVTAISDTMSSNDTLCSSFIINTIVPLSYFDDFENGNVNWNILTTGNPATQWELGTPAYGNTNLAYSGSSCWDINLASAYGPTANTSLISPLFDMNGVFDPELSFYLNYETEVQWDGLRVDYSINQGLTWQTLGSPGDPNATNWYNTASLNSSSLPGWAGNSAGFIKSTYDLNALGSVSTLQLRFVFRSDFSVHGAGVSMDDFSIRIASPTDAAMVKFISPVGNVSSTASTPVTVQLKNEGYLPFTSVPLRLLINNGSPVDITWNGNLAPDSSVNVSFPAQVFPGGIHDLKAFINWPPDTYYYNDTAEVTIQSILTLPPPCSDNFDGSSNPWIPLSDGLPGTNWEHGTPVYGQTTFAHTLPMCWDINLYAQYTNLAQAFLYSPVFDLTNLSGIDINFWLNYNTEAGSDGVVLEYSLDDANWYQLGLGSDPTGTNWFNSTLFNNQQGWSGGSPGWVQSRYLTWGFAGAPYFRLRFKFVSDFSITSDGVLMDDFSISSYTGLNENADFPFKIYPNPVHDHLYLNELPNGSYILSISDLSGRVLYEEVVKGNSYRVDMHSFTAGTYIVRVRNERQDHSQRIVKM